MRRKLSDTSVLLAGAGGGSGNGGSNMQKPPFNCINCGHDGHTVDF